MKFFKWFYNRLTTRAGGPQPLKKRTLSDSITYSYPVQVMDPIEVSAIELHELIGELQSLADRAMDMRGRLVKYKERHYAIPKTTPIIEYLIDAPPDFVERKRKEHGIGQ